MTEQEKHSTGLFHTGDKLRQLLLEHPDLPLLVFASDDANSGDYAYTSCGSVSVEVGEFLDCKQTLDDTYCFIDRDELEEKIADSMCDFSGSEQEFDNEVKRIVAEYAPYWRPCIIVYVGN